MTETTSRIIKAIRAVPRGKVSCYRDIALAAGLPNGARQVVRVLHSMTEKYKLPWHRIIRAEGVEVSETGRIDLGRYGRRK